MRGNFAQLKSRKTFSGGVVGKNMKQIFPFTRIGYVYNFTSDAMRCDCSSNMRFPSTGLFAVWRFFHPSLFFHGKKEVFPISTQQYYDFQKLLIVKLLNYSSNDALLFYDYMLKKNVKLFKIAAVLAAVLAPSTAILAPSTTLINVVIHFCY